MLKVPRVVGSEFHLASGRTATFPNGLIILTERNMQLLVVPSSIADLSL
jgi:hypothetical protein